MSNPYFNYRGERGSATGSGGPPGGAAAATAAHKEVQYAQMSLAGLNEVSQQQQQSATLSRSGLAAQQQVWASDQPTSGGQTLLSQGRGSIAQQSRVSAAMNGGAFSISGGRPLGDYGVSDSSSDINMGGQNRSASEAYLMISKGVNTSDSYGTGSRKSAVFDPSDFPTLGGGLGGNSSIGVVSGSSSKNMNGFGPYSDVYSLGSAYGSGRIKAVDALTANPNGAGFSMQKEDFPALGGGLGGGLGRAVSGSLGRGIGSEVVGVGSSLSTNGLLGARSDVEEPTNETVDSFLRRSAGSTTEQREQEQSLQKQQSQQQQGSQQPYVQPQFRKASSLHGRSGSAATNSATPEKLPENKISRSPHAERSPGATVNGSSAYSRGTSTGRSMFQPYGLQRGAQVSELDASRQASLGEAVLSSAAPTKGLASHSRSRFAQVGVKDNVKKVDSSESVNRANVISVGTQQGDGAVLMANSSSVKVTNDALPEDQYGMRGLIKTLDPAKDGSENMLLTRGLDLTTLGLELNSTMPLYQYFDTPWIEFKNERESAPGVGPRGVIGGKAGDLEKRLPKCYQMHPPALKVQHFSKFSLETLFYIFYSMPQDILQLYVAVELYRHQWRYHKNLKLWFARSRSPGPTLTIERNGYVYFDVNSWERRPFTDASTSLSQGFLSEEEIRAWIKRKPGVK